MVTTTTRGPRAALARDRRLPPPGVANTGCQTRAMVPKKPRAALATSGAAVPARAPVTATRVGPTTKTSSCRVESAA